MKEECKLCSVNGWGGQTTDFSIASLMRPAPAQVPPPGQAEPRHDAVLLSAYLLKLGDYPLYTLHDYCASSGKPKRKCNCRGCETTPYNPYGYYQPAGPLIKETSADADRALARYHPPHYHAPHPPMIQQYGPSYYPADLCYGRYYRPPGPYHMPAPDAQIVGVGSEPYPSQFYGTPPCYQHSQRIPYVEYRACPCPLNACPKNVHIGPATGKPPTGAGPDVAAALAPPGGAFRVNTSDSLARGKDPPLSPQLSAASDAGAAWGARGAGGVSPARERPALPGERPAPPALPGERPALPAARPPAPPSPARGEAGACAPHPPTPAPRKARLGKAMARRSLAREETTNIQQLTLPKAPPTPDDEVIPISPPECNPIDLSSDERSTPLVDVKKENEGPTQTSPRKPDAQALREHNTSVETSDPLKPTRRRYSRPKLEIDMKDVTLEESLKTNGIGEHVKLQKRRKVSGDQPEPPRIETVTRDPKRKTPSTPRRTLKTPPAEKRCPKRKLDVCGGASKPKKLLLSSPIKDDPRLKNIAALPEETHILTANAKSAPAVLDNLLRKNSINRDESVLNIEKNPAELFLSSKEKSLHNPDVKIHSINNNILQNSNSVKEVLTSIASVENQLLKKKVQNKSSCKLDVVADSKITVNSKSLRPPVDKSEAVDEPKISVPNNATELNSRLTSADNSDSHSETCKNKCDIIKSDHFNCENSISNKCDKVTKPTKAMKLLKSPNKIEMKTPVEETPGLPSDTSLKTSDAVAQEITEIDGKLPIRSIPSNEIKGKTVEKLVKLLASKRAAKLEESNQDLDMLKDKKRSKLGVEKSAGKEKVAKLLVSKKSAIKTDTASLVIEDACSSWRRGRGRRAGPRRRPAPEPSPPAPALAPRWSNGWTWHGHHYISRVYLNNDSRMDRTARCWARMTHASGDSVSKGDCVLLRANVARAQPFVARVASLWENPEDGEMMVSLVWYYRPEHTELGRQPTDAPDEVFASKHRDANSVACIEDKCYVLTFNEYCRYRKRLKAAEECVHIKPSIVPPMPASEVTPAIAPNDSKLPPAVSPELVLFCRKIYDFRSKKLQVPNK